MGEIERHVQAAGARGGARPRSGLPFYSAAGADGAALEHREDRARRYPPTKFIEGARPYRERFRRDGVGVFDAPYLPLNPRTRKVAETDAMDCLGCRARRLARCVRLGRAGGAQGPEPGERRPVVVCQHGRNGVPRDTIDRQTRPTTTSARRWPSGDSSSFAPHNLYRGEDRYRWLESQGEQR